MEEVVVIEETDVIALGEIKARFAPRRCPGCRPT